jgi:hypothetical protein
LKSIAHVSGALVKEEYRWPGVLVPCQMKGELGQKSRLEPCIKERRLDEAMWL